MSNKLQIKQVDLSRVQKDVTKVKFLVIDDDGNVFWNDTAGGNVTYTNPDPVPVTIGGIEAGSTFDNVTMQEMWTELLYPYQVPAFTFFTVSGSNPLEVGESLSSTLSFSWDSSNDPNVEPNSIEITDTTGIILTGQPADGSSVPYTYSSPVIRTTYGSYIWNITGKNTNGGNYISSNSKSWYWKIYWGANSSNSIPTEAFVLGLTNAQLFGSRQRTYQFAANNYKYLAIPSSYGVPISIAYNGLPLALADANDGYSLGTGNITYTQVSITNSFGQSETYNVFRSKNPLVGSVSMLVS